MFCVGANFIACPSDYEVSGLNSLFSAGPGLSRSKKPHARPRGQSLPGRYRVRGAVMKALNKLKVCLRTSATEEELPLFHSPSAGFGSSVKPCTKVPLLLLCHITMLGRCCT